MMTQQFIYNFRSKILFTFTLILAVLLYFNSAYICYAGNYTWVERQPSGGALDTTWGVATDADGSNLIVGASTGRLYTSSNSGVAWTERQPAGASDFSWLAVASDADGSNLIATAWMGRLYTSADSGATWTERQPAGDTTQSWYSVASDDDGSNLIAVVNGGRIYTSADSGATWTERQPAGNNNMSWVSVASDSDGSNLIVGIVNGRLYTSADSGATWTERQPAGAVNKNWRVGSDSDGSHLIAGIYGGRLYTSADSGVTWTERQPAGAVNKNWNTVASDADGSHFMAAAYAGRLYVSSDGGSTWTEEQPAGAVDKNWRSVATDADGTNIIVGVTGGRLYTSTDTTPPTITSISSDKANGSYKTGEVIDIDVNFSEPVTSTGNVTVTLETGDTDRTCTFSISDASTGTCNYTVQAGDTSSDLNATISGTIADASTNSMTNYTPATTLATAKALVIDTTPPTVNAGSDQAKNALFTQDATVSDDTSGVATYAWSKVSGPGTITFDSDNEADPDISASTDGTYVIRLTVTDNAGNSNYDEFTLIWDTVNPTVNAGSDQSKGASYTQDATASDATSGIASYLWSKTSGLGTVTFGTATAEDSTVFADTDGTYVIRLTVTDNAGNSNYDEFTLIWDSTLPTVSTYFPADNATGVTTTANLILTFSEAVDAETGNITLYKSDDTLVEQFDVTSEITGSGSTSITINPTSDLSYETSYYVQIDATAFDDASSNSYAGISDVTTWSFTTEANPTCPTIANAATYNAYPTCGVATCNSGYTLTNGTCVANATGGGGAPTPPPAIGTGAVDVIIGMGQTKDVGAIGTQGVNTMSYINSKIGFTSIVSTINSSQAHNYVVSDLNMITKVVTLTFNSKTVIISLALDETKQVDLDGDGINDIEVTYVDLVINRIEITIRDFLESNTDNNYEGKLIKYSNSPKVYLIQNKQKRWIINEAAFNFYKYNWNEIITIDIDTTFTDGQDITDDTQINTSIFTRNLKLGMVGADIKALQRYLNTHGYLISQTGFGSPGNETAYFGQKTKEALVKFQKVNNISPAVGYFGPITRKTINR